jgi:hypothetical protein
MVEKFPVGLLLSEWIGILQDPTGSCRTCLTRVITTNDENNEQKNINLFLQQQININKT